MKYGTLALFFISSLALVACGDEPASDTNNQQSNNQQSNNQSQNNQPKEDSSFKVESKSDDQTEVKVEHKIDNEQASKQNGGASIAGSVLSLYLVAPNGTTVSAIVETTQSLRAPGNFSVTSPPDGTYVTWLDPANGQILESKGGTIELSNCPTQVGQQVVGKIKDVVLTSAFDNSERTIKGDFDMILYAKSGDLFCVEKPSQNNANTNNTNNTCNFNEYCDDGGSCCPYAPCMTMCQTRCIQQDSACNDPFNADPIKCGQCLDACLDSCKVNQQCRDDYTALATCEDNAKCDAFGDEDTYKACLKGSCCAEVSAAF